MTREEVISAIGKPDYSIDESRPGRAVKGSYLFEYRQGKQVMFVSFKQDKVTKLRYFVEP
jgi:hypothetical protein